LAYSARHQYTVVQKAEITREKVFSSMPSKIVALTVKLLIAVIVAVSY
jgi:hypothetical protein